MFIMLNEQFDINLQASRIIQMRGEINLGKIDGLGIGAVSKFREIINPQCRNKRTLNKHGWDPTQTPTRTFQNCQIKR